MKDIRKTTIDSILKDYFYAINSSKLSEDNIDIDDSIVVEESTQRYIQLLASFLNEAYYMGYIMSESILNRLLNIINYEGYEYQIMNAYADILMGSMNDMHGDDDNRPVYKRDMLSYSDAKGYVTDYVDAVRHDNEINSLIFPHYRNPNSKEDDKQFLLMFLNEEDYPIDRIYKDFENVTHPIQIAEYAYILYRYNKPAYLSYLNKTNDVYAYIFFLLDNMDNMSLDIILDNIKSIPSLAKLIDKYAYFNITGTLEDANKPEGTYSKFSDNANKNIYRLFEILLINVSDEQTAMLIGLNENIWTNYCDANHEYIDLSRLTKALDLYKSHKKYTILNPVEYIYTIGTKYPDDAYFYARHCLMNMDYVLFFTNFVKMYNYLIKFINTKDLVDLASECIECFKNLKVPAVNESIDNLYIELCFETSKDTVADGLIELRDLIKSTN